MKYRKLRIAWSVTWGVAAVLLCVLWVRSVDWVDFVNAPIGQTYRCSAMSMAGVVSLYVGDNEAMVSWECSSQRMASWRSDLLLVGEEFPTDNWGEFRYDRGGVMAPNWFLIASAAAIAAVPWIPLRFSLRTLLIVTTLVAVAMGLIVWLR